MLEHFAHNADAYIHGNPWLAIVAVFAGGVLTASSPCVLAMIPLMMSYVAGQKEDQGRLRQAFGFSLVFVSGLALTFTALGVIAALAGTLYGDVSGLWNWIVAVVSVLMGLQVMELINIPIPSLAIQSKTIGIIGAFTLGLLFGLVSAPCAAPILVVLLTYLAGSGASLSYGALLLLVYALGHSLLILVAGTSMGAARTLIENKKMTRVTAWLRRGAGAVIVLVGLYFAYRALL